MSVRLWGAALLLAVAAVGCSTSGSDSPSGPQQAGGGWESGTVPLPGKEAREITVPFDEYNISPADAIRIDTAEDSLVGECMRERGMKWTVAPLPPERDIAPPNRRRYGVVEPDAARVFGFHNPQDRPSVARRNKELDTRGRKISPEVRRAAYGDESKPGPGGCLKKARDQMMKGAPKINVSLFNKRSGQTFEASQRDAKVERVFRSWSACMKEAGFRYKDPLAAATDERWGTDKPSRKEIRTAQADVRCKEKTDLTAIWMAAEKRIQDDVIREHPKEFRALKVTKDVQLKAARRILG
ncbi:hypothetical protein J7F01_36185 [Streptomyces sp. ISL-22]|uniref:hypothetical protein n=1 Tax=unclassified Streptomyces TaxID=2593676 RepID=UPI001BEA7926|nr:MULTISPECIES: hypothetical protein [unclassified Streptomyces]MBT2423861.1 hypothetical protein [Streptomyces sp. ISL-24]MBT2437497.1 hypothetical protein [Streptomyces sp. ISL-22]